MTFSEMLKNQKVTFEIIDKKEKNLTIYQVYTPSSISFNNIITEVGIMYKHAFIIRTDTDELINISNKSDGKFIKNTDKYATLIGVSYVNDLIGLNSNEFAKRINERYENEQKLNEKISQKVLTNQKICDIIYIVKDNSKKKTKLK